MASQPLSDDQLSVKVRHRLDLTQAELAQLLGAHPITVTRWEKGHYTLSPWRRSMLLRMLKRKAKGVSAVLKSRGTFAAFFAATAP